MSGRTLLIALVLVIVAVVLQTTLFLGAATRPFGVAPDLVLLVLVASVRHLDPEPGILLGFTGGLLLDLLGSSPLGIWALVMTVVAYLTIRMGTLAEERPLIGVAGVFGLTLVGMVLYIVVATLFGLQPLRNPLLVRILVLTPTYNTLLALAMLPVVSWLLRPRRRARRGVLA